MNLWKKANGKKLPITALLGVAITFGALQSQVIGNKDDIKVLKPNTVEIAKVEERVKGLDKNFTEFKTEQRAYNIRVDDKLDKILSAVK